MGRRLFASGIVTACLSAVVFANHTATFVLRDGKRVSGELSYKGGTSYTLNGQDYPSSNIAIIAFVDGAPSAAELNQIPTVDNNPSEHERHVFVTRSGELIFGKIYHISADGNTFTFDRREGGRHDIASDSLARVYVNPAAARSIYHNNNVNSEAAAAGAVGNGGRRVNVNAAQQWTDTGIDVTGGERLAFEASGEVRFGAAAGMTATPNGNEAYHGNFSAPSLPVGALVGRVGNGAPFGIGMQTQPLAMPGSGRLYLGVNDDQFGDNSGAFAVTIRR